jgi:L-ribulose-5-phosphate 3-epimerase
MQNTLNLGIRGHDLKGSSLDALLTEARDYGFSHLQLALNMSFPDCPSDAQHINPGMAKFVHRACRQNAIDISVLSCYINMIHPDQTVRTQLLDKFKAYLRYARDFGAGLVATETGNVNKDIIYCVDNFTETAYQQTLASVKIVVEEAQRCGVIVGIEAGLNHPIYSPTVVKRLLDDVNSNAMQIVLDPTNLIDASSWQQQQPLIEQSFELFGDRIAIVHLKDFIIEHGKMKIVAVGQGQMNFEPLLKLIKQHRPLLQCVLEETRSPYIPTAIAALRQMYQRL